MAREGLNTLIGSAKQADQPRCEAGCMSFDGGEKKHHRDCVHYPESLTKLWHDTETEYLAEIGKLRQMLRDQFEGWHDPDCKVWRDSVKVCTCGHDEVKSALAGTEHQF